MNEQYIFIEKLLKINGLGKESCKSVINAIKGKDEEIEVLETELKELNLTLSGEIGIKDAEITALKEQLDKAVKVIEKAEFYVLKAEEVAKMVNVRLNPENSINKEDLLNHISESYLFNQSTICLLSDAKQFLESLKDGQE